MHRLPSSSTVIRFRCAAFLLCLIFLLVPTAFAILARSIFTLEQELAFAGLGILGVTLAIALYQRILSARARCPLCMMPPLVRQGCAKHRSARKLFGSHRLRVAAAIVFKGSFRCPYCGEPTAMKVRQRNPQMS